MRRRRGSGSRVAPPAPGTPACGFENPSNVTFELNMERLIKKFTDDNEPV